MIEPPKEIYIYPDFPEWDKGTSKNAVPYILKPRWIPVEEGLPGDLVRECQVTYRPTVAPDLRVGIAHRAYRGTKWLTGNGRDFERSYGKVIAWQPIPLDDPYIPPSHEPPS